MFCVVCGKETEEELRRGECASCYLEKNVIASVKDHVDVEVCVHCHARKRGEIWMEGHGDLAPVVEDAVRDAVFFAKVIDKPRMRVDIAAEDERNFTVVVHASGSAEGVPFDKKLETRSRVKNATCVRCSRVQGGYYEAIVQVRATKRELEIDERRAIKQLSSKFIERIVTDGDRNAFVLRDQDVDRGLDIYMGTTNSGRMLAKAISVEWGGKVSEHPKTVGQKDGLDIIRMTFAVKLPEYRAGDIVVVSETPYIVSSIGPKTVQLNEIRSGKLRHIERAEVERALVLSPRDAREAVVVSRSETELQVLDPWTYATVPILRPTDVGEIGESVDVLKHDGDLIIVRKRNV